MIRFLPNATLRLGKMFKRGGHIFNPKGVFSWATSHALQPTPYLTDEGIRVYCGFRDVDGVSRVGYVLLDEDNPAIIKGVSKGPVLDIGEPGCFDDNGVVPCFLYSQNEYLYLYYAGYQLVNKIKFQVFGGIAVSEDGGGTFERLSIVPFTDRTDAEPFFRVTHSLIKKSDDYLFFYGGGNRFIKIEKKVFPSYNIRMFASKSFDSQSDNGVVILDFENADEYRIARPYVYEDYGMLYMLYYLAKTDGSFEIQRAKSEDWITWKRDDEFKIAGVREDWELNMMAYPAYIRTKNLDLIFYNGNNYGENGFGFLFKER